MAATTPGVEIDLTAVPAQRVSHEDTLEVVHHADVASTAPVAARPDRRMWLALFALAALAGLGIGIPAGPAMGPSTTQPAPPPGRNDLSSLLPDPLGTQPPQPMAPPHPQERTHQNMTPA